MFDRSDPCLFLDYNFLCIIIIAMWPCQSYMLLFNNIYICVDQRLYSNYYNIIIIDACNQKDYNVISMYTCSLHNMWYSDTQVGPQL